MPLITAYTSLGYIGAAKESTPGTGVTPTKFWKLQRGLTQADQTVTPYRDGNSQDITFDLKELVMGKGSFETFLYADEGAALLAWVLGTDTVSGVADPYTHTLAFNNSLPFISVEMGAANNQIIDRMAGALVNSVQLVGNVGKPVMVTGDVLSATLAKQVSAATVSFADALANGPMTFVQGALTLTGPSDAATLQAQMTKFDLKVNRNVQPVPIFGQITPGTLLPTARSVDLSLEAVFSGPSVYQLTYYGSATGTAPSATIGTGSLVIALTSQGAVPGPERSITLTMSNIDFIAVGLPQISPDGKFATVTVKAQPKLVAATMPLSAVVKNGVALAYT